jgi:hypothetical protein
MPRMNLTEDEAAHIERLRAKHTADINFNQGLEEACGIIDIVLANSAGHNKLFTREGFAQECKTALRAQKRKIVL